MAQLKKYELQDLSIWKEWLVYATALGVGEKVANAMKELNINVAEARYYPFMIYSFVHINRTYQAAYAPKGGGGGFGGSGAGGR